MKVWSQIDKLIMQQAFLVFFLVMMMRSASAFFPVTSMGTNRALMRNTAGRSFTRKTDVKMVIFWSIKSTYDLVKFGLGQDDKFKGTGVFSLIEFDRKKDDNDAETKTVAADETKKDLSTKDQPSLKK